MSIRHRSVNWEKDAAAFPADAYKVSYYPGIAFRVLGWETEPDEDTEWTGMETRTGNAIAVMIGDDRKHSVDPEDLSPIAREEYCGECGQLGCGHDGLERGDA